MAAITTSDIFLVIALYFCGRVLYQIVKYRFYHPLKQFPGPWLASVTRLWIAYHHVRANESYTFRELHKKHGPVIRITPTLLHIADATKLPEIYCRGADKSQHYISGSFGTIESVFNMQDHKVHAYFRKIAASPYSFSNIKKMEPLLDATIGYWISRLDDLFAETGKKFDFAPWAVYMAYDVISEVGFGAPFGFIKEGKDVGGLIEGFHVGMVRFGILARLWPFTSWMKTTFLAKYLVATPEQESGIGAVMRFRDNLLAQRLADNERTATGSKRIDLLQNFLETKDEDGKPLDLEYVKAEILLVLLAGADTTGTTFQAIVRHVSQHPSALERILAEIESANLSEIPQYDEVVNRCPYYIACVREAMRLNPAAPSIFPRLALSGGLDLYGMHAPEGTELTCNPWIVHRDPQVVGDDPDEFRPERWLEDETRAKNMLTYNMVFGYGPRECLGKHLAMMELFKAPILFFRTFTPEMVNKKNPGRYMFKGGISYFQDMWMTIKRRSQSV
jgi:cytochrome P450